LHYKQFLEESVDVIFDLENYKKSVKYFSEQTLSWK